MGKLPSSLARPRGALSGRVTVWPCAERAAEGGLGARERRVTVPRSYFVLSTTLSRHSTLLVLLEPEDESEEYWKHDWKNW